MSILSLAYRIPYTLWAYFVIVAGMAFFAVLYLSTAFLAPKRAPRVAYWWGRSTLALLCPVEHRNIEALPDGPFAIFANHASFIDILALQTLPADIRFIAKRLFFQIPLVGGVLKHRGDVMMAKRAGGADQDRRAMVREIREGAGASTLATWKDDDARRALVVFAEGTRARDGKLAPFRTRNLAHQVADAGLPVVPVALKGTFRLWPASSLLFTPSRVVVCVTEPIESDSPKELLEQAHRQVAAALEE